MKIIMCCFFIYFNLISLAQSTKEISDTLYSPRFSEITVLSQLFEMLRNTIKHGKAGANLPPLDPYDVEFFEVHLNNMILNVDAAVTKAQFTGLSEFNILKSEFNKTEISIDLEVYFPKLTLYSGHYDMNGTLYEFLPVRGSGSLMLSFNNVKLWGKVWLRQSRNMFSILIDKFESAVFNVESTNSQMQFDGNIDALIDQMIEELLAGYLNRFNKAITGIYGFEIILAINKYLDNFDSWRFLSLILN